MIFRIRGVESHMVPSSKICFSAELTIRVSDLNYGNHVGNDRFLGLAQEARALFLSRYGGTEKDVSGTGVGIIVTEARLHYLKEVFLHRVLIIDIALSEWTKCSVIMDYLFKEKETGLAVCKARTKIAFFDYRLGKVAAVPAGFKDKINLLAKDG